MKKTIIALLLTAFLLGACACGGGGKETAAESRPTGALSSGEATVNTSSEPEKPSDPAGTSTPAPGSEEDWNKIEWNESSDILKNATIVYDYQR